MAIKVNKNFIILGFEDKEEKLNTLNSLWYLGITISVLVSHQRYKKKGKWINIKLTLALWAYLGMKTSNLLSLTHGC